MTEKDELLRLKIAKEVKEQSDKDYAVKIVEKIVFWLVAMVGVAVVGALLNLVIK